MPEIGKPNLKNNSFKNISMHRSARLEALKKPNDDLANKLNDIVGIREKSRFVDAKKHNKLGKDGFLKLLAHQLANQDPTKPMDQKSFAADLAQFAQLEQLANLNSKFDKSNANVHTESKAYGVSFLGKKIRTNGTTLNYDGQSNKVNIPFTLPHAAKKVMVRIFDKKNQMIGQMEVENLPKGEQLLVWDGMMLDKTRATKEMYTFSVKAWDEQYLEFKGKTKAEGIVTGVNFVNGETILIVDGKKKVFLRDAEEFYSPEITGGVKKLPTLKSNAVSAYNKTTTQ